MRSIIKSGFALALILMLCAGAWAMTATGPAKSAPVAKDKGYKTLKANAWQIYSTNYGPFVFPRNSTAGGAWSGPGYTYIYGAGVYFGALDAGGTPHVAAGYNPNNGASEFCPANPFTWDYSHYASDHQARLYLSTTPSDLADWPVKDANGSNLIQSIEDGYATYTDRNTSFTSTGEQPVGINIRQWSYAWNYADNNNIVFFYFRLINASGHALDHCYIGPLFDADIGNESGTAANDLVAFDQPRNMAIQYQLASESGWPTGGRTGQLGVRYFESPLNNTGAPITVVDDSFSHTIAPNAQLGMTAFKIFNIAIDPTTDADRYKEQQGIDYKTNRMDAYDVDNYGPSDKRFIMSSGPFNMANGDSATTCCGVMCEWDRPQLLKTSDVAQDIYNNHFQLAVPPVSAEITTIPGDKYVRISWTRKSETTPDTYYDKIPNYSRWFTYYTGTWKYLRDKTKVDSFRIKTGAATDVVIARGAANPAGGTDTMEAFYNQHALYEPYDFQSYTLFRAKTQADLVDPAKREVLGGSYTNPITNATGYMFDKVDSVMIVRDLRLNNVNFPDTTSVILPIFDTIGTDRGLIYSYVDNDVINNFGYYYGIACADYQPNVYFTRKCPTSLSSNPASGSKFGSAMSPLGDYKPAAIRYTATGGSDMTSLGGTGTLDNNDNLIVGNANNIANATYIMRWQPAVRYLMTDPGLSRVPQFTAFIYPGTASTRTDGFEIGSSGLLVPAGWSFTGITAITDTTGHNFGAAIPSIKFDQTGDTATTSRFINPTSLSYWYQGIGTDGLSKLLVQGYNGVTWTVVDSVFPTATGTTKQVVIASPISRVRFVYIKSAGDLALDDVAINAQHMLDTTGIIPTYGLNPASTSLDSVYFGSSFDQVTFGGILYQPFLLFKPKDAKIDSFNITESGSGTRAYSKDSCVVQLDPNSWKYNVAQWMWRGSDFEIRWRDTTVKVGAIDTAAITCTVWDLDNNVAVPFQGGLNKNAMTRSSWCFGPAAGGSTGPYIYKRNASNTDNWGLFICGITVYFRPTTNTPPVNRNMVWANRPETGDVWRINCSGPKTPIEGHEISFTTTAPGQTASLGTSLLDKVLVVPNPYLVRANWDITPDFPNLYFTNLPAKCTIRIYTMAGDLVRVLDHESSYASNNSVEKWNLLTTYNKRIASGLYIYHLDAPGIGTKIGKFAVIK